MKKVPFVPRSLSTIKPIASTLPAPSKHPDQSTKAPSPAAQSLLDALFKAPRLPSTFTGATLYFASAREARKVPFDPLSKPKRVYKAAGKAQRSGNGDAEWLIAMLKTQASKQRQVKAEQVNAEAEPEILFPDAGIFDEHAALEEALKSKSRGKASASNAAANKSAKSRLFKSKQETAVEAKEAKEVDVFKLISGGAEEEEEETGGAVDEKAGGLFGFTMDLPQLNRTQAIKSTDDPYNLSDSEEGKGPAEEEEPFEYDAGDEDELITTQADDEGATGKVGRKKRRAKEESEIRAVERIMRTKYQENL